MKKTILVLGLIGVGMFLWFCSQGPTAGSGTQVGNPAIMAKLVYSNGKPAAGVMVHLRVRSFIDTSNILAGNLPKAVDSASTGADGVFKIDSVGTGLYVIDAEDNDSNGVRIDSVAVTHPDSSTDLGTDTLKHFGSIKGIVYIPENGNPTKVFILALGLGRFVVPDSLGRFSFDSLAEGRYCLKFISTQPDYAVKDTAGVRVVSNQITALDTVKLTFTGIPTPKNLSITYDTLKQIVTLIWSKADSNLVKGYGVYRRNVDSNAILTKINTSTITDTIYRDSTGVQDMTYEYKVVAVSPTDMEGTKSAVVSVKVVSVFNLIGSFGSAGSGDGQFNNPTGLALGIGSSVFVADVKNNRVQKFDFNGNFVTQFGTLGRDSGKFNNPFDIAVDRSGNIFVADFLNNKIQKFDSLQNWVASLGGLSNPQCVAVDSKGNIYVNEIDSPIIKKYDNNLHFVLEWGHKGNDSTATGGIQSITIDSLDRIYVLNSYRVMMFDTLGNYLKGIPSWDTQMLRDISIIHDKLFVLDAYNRKILEFTLDGQLVTKFGNGNFYSIIALPNGEIWASDLAEQKIYRFER